MISRHLLWLAFVSLACSSCTNPFAPTPVPPPGPDPDPHRPATEPEIVMDNLERAVNEQDDVLYETLLDDGFWFTEPDCLGDVVYENGREEEIEIMFGPRDGASEGIFDIFRTINYEFLPIERRTELGRDSPIAFEGDPDGHPQEDWEVFRGRVRMLLLINADDGNRIDQDMSFKMRRGDDGLWRIRRWIDDPLAGDCGGASVAKSTGTTLIHAPWAQHKER